MTQPDPSEGAPPRPAGRLIGGSGGNSKPPSQRFGPQRSPSGRQARPPSERQARPPSERQARPPSERQARPPSGRQERRPSGRQERPTSGRQHRPPSGRLSGPSRPPSGRFAGPPPAPAEGPGYEVPPPPSRLGAGRLGTGRFEPEESEETGRTPKKKISWKGLVIAAVCVVIGLRVLGAIAVRVVPSPRSFTAADMKVRDVPSFRSSSPPRRPSDAARRQRSGTSTTTRSCEAAGSSRSCTTTFPTTRPSVEWRRRLPGQRSKGSSRTCV